MPATATQPALNPAYARAAVKTDATIALSESEPATTKLVSHVTLTNDQMNGVLAWTEDNYASAEESAV